MVARLKSRPIGLKFDNCGLQCLVCTRNYFYIRLFLAFSKCFQLSRNFQKFWLRNKWTALVWVEIFWSKWFTFRGGPLWPVSPVQQKTCLSISKNSHLQSYFAKQSSKFWSEQKWITSIWLETLFQLNNVIPFFLDNSTGFYLTGFPKWKAPVVSQKFSPTDTLPRFELNISWKRWILHTKFVSTVCKDFINRTVADFLDLTRAFFITSGGWFCRTSWNVLFKLIPLEEFSSLCSDNTARLEVLGQKISTGSWSGLKTEPYTSTDPIRVLIRANPLMQTLWFKTKTNRTK